MAEVFDVDVNVKLRVEIEEKEFRNSLFIPSSETLRKLVEQDCQQAVKAAILRDDSEGYDHISENGITTTLQQIAVEKIETQKD